MAPAHAFCLAPAASPLSKRTVNFSGAPLTKRVSKTRSVLLTRASASSEVLEKVKTVVGDQLGVSVGDIKESSKFVDDLGADSLDAVEMVMALEEEFDVSIEGESAEGMSTVQEAANLIAGELAKKGK